MSLYVSGTRRVAGTQGVLHKCLVNRRLSLSLLERGCGLSVSAWTAMSPANWGVLPLKAKREAGWLWVTSNLCHACIAGLIFVFVCVNIWLTFVFLTRQQGPWDQGQFENVSQFSPQFIACCLAYSRCLTNTRWMNGNCCYYYFYC